jgi:protein TonB
MRWSWTRNVALAGVAAVTWGCNQPPQPEIEAANTALERARGSQASKYASAPMKEAEEAKAALDQEMQAQGRAWVKSYDRARELALETKNAADRASVDAAAARDTGDRPARLKLESRRATVERAVIEDPVKIKDVAPVYPAIARDAGVEGTVTIQATIDKDGYVSAYNVVRSVPLLNQAAVDAVKQWEYRPQTVGGKPVKSVVTVNVNFRRS